MNPPAKQSSPLSIFLQILGTLVGLAALAWCVHLALSPENRTLLSQLRGISFTNAALLIGLTIASVALNGLCFWSVVRPRHALKPTDVIAVNFIATLLGLLPFKVSVIFRGFIHNRRDGIPLLTIGAWFSIVGLAAAIVVGPLATVSRWRGEIDGVWLLTVLTTIPFLALCAMLTARYLDGPAGRERLIAHARRLPTSFPEKFAASPAFTHLHAGLGMIASRWFIVSLLVRSADVLVQAARFLVVSNILGVQLDYSQSLLLSSCYFLIGVISPSGAAGSREGGVTALAKLFGIAQWQSIAPVALTVSACELIVLIAATPVAALILQPWKHRDKPPSPAHPAA